MQIVWKAHRFCIHQETVAENTCHSINPAKLLCLWRYSASMKLDLANFGPMDLPENLKSLFLFSSNQHAFNRLRQPAQTRITGITVEVCTLWIYTVYPPSFGLQFPVYQVSNFIRSIFSPGFKAVFNGELNASTFFWSYNPSTAVWIGITCLGKMIPVTSRASLGPIL